MVKLTHNLNSLKEKISPKKSSDDSSIAIAEKFKLADKTLGIIEKPHLKPFEKVAKKTFSIPNNELKFIDEIKEKALNKRIVLSESETIRLGILIAKETSEDNLAKFAKQLEILPKGRPKR